MARTGKHCQITEQRKPQKATDTNYVINLLSAMGSLENNNKSATDSMKTKWGLV